MTRCLMLMGAVLLLALAGGLASAQEPRAPLEVMVFHKPTCPECQKMVALLPEMAEISPKLRFVLHTSDKPGDQDFALQLNRSSVIPPEEWGSIFVLYLGSEWKTAEGQAVLGKLHQFLWERKTLKPTEWPPESYGVSWGGVTPLAHLRQTGLAEAGRMALKFAEQKGMLLELALLTGVLFFVGQDRRRLRRVGYAFVAGVMAVYLVCWLGIMPRSLQTLSPPWKTGDVFTVVGLIGLALALRGWREYRRAEKLDLLGRTPERPREGWPLTWRGTALAGLGGLLVGVLTAMMTGQWYMPGMTVLSAMHAYTLRNLALLGVYWLLTGVPLIALVVVAAEVGASESMQQWTREHPADAKKAGFLLLLVLAVLLLARVVSMMSYRAPI